MRFLTLLGYLILVIAHGGECYVIANELANEDAKAAEKKEITTNPKTEEEAHMEMQEEYTNVAAAQQSAQEAKAGNPSKAH